MPPSLSFPIHAGVLYAPTGTRGTIIALNGSDGTILWESEKLSNESNFRIGAPPVVWQDYLLIGAALGDQPPVTPATKGSLKALNRTTGNSSFAPY